MSSPIITVKVKETLELEKNGESEEEINIELETTSETKGTKYRNRNDFRRPSLCSSKLREPNLN